MSDATTIGPIIFWAGVLLAYIGVCIPPALIYNDLKFSMFVLRWTAILGWFGMLYAAGSLQYQPARAWLDMTGAYVLGASCLLLGLVLTLYRSNRVAA